MTHRVLVVGVGSIGERHTRCFERIKHATIWICEPNETLRQRVSSEYHVERAEADLDGFLKTPPDAAVICTPADQHIPIAIRLAQVGVHLLIEKPLSTNLNDFQELNELGCQKNLVLAVAYVLRHHPALIGLRDALHSGQFGKPRQLVFNSGQNFAHYRPAYREIYYASHAKGGGAIQDALTHGINAAEWLVGPVSDLIADADHQLLDGVEVEDTVHVLARHGDVMASYSLNQYQAPNETTWTVVCERGTLRCRLHDAVWEWQTSPKENWSLGGHYPVERDELFERQAIAFLNAVEIGQSSPCTLAEAKQTLQDTLAIMQSIRNKSWQQVGSEVTDV